MMLRARFWLATTFLTLAGSQVVDKTILHTHNLDKFLWFPPEQRPLVLQLGGSEPDTLAAAAAAAYRYGGGWGGGCRPLRGAVAWERWENSDVRAPRLLPNRPGPPRPLLACRLRRNQPQLRLS
jgi:hypothetical protein